MNPPRDRDRHRVITPPAGVANQIARPIQAPRHAVNKPDGVDPDDWDPDATPLPVDPTAALTVIAARTKRSTEIATANRTIATTAVEVAGDTRRGVRQVEGRVENLAYQVGQLDGKLDQLALSVAQITGQLGEIMKDRDEQRVVRIETARTELELHRTSRIDAIEARRQRRQFLGQAATKILAGASTAAAAILAAIMAGKGC